MKLCLDSRWVEARVNFNALHSHSIFPLQRSLCCPDMFLDSIFIYLVNNISFIFCAECIVLLVCRRLKAVEMEKLLLISKHKVVAITICVNLK